VSFEKYESASLRGWGSNRKLLPETVVYWDYLAGCYWYWNATRMAEMAKALGREDDEAKFKRMAAEAHGYVKSEFFKDGGRLPVFLRDMQTPHLFALRLGFYDRIEARKESIAMLLENIDSHGGCLQTGFLGTSILMDTLTYHADRPDVAYSLLLQHNFPSWLYSVDQGATTIWERWNSYTKEKGFGPAGMNSFNHYAYGAVLDWIYGTAAGLNPGKEGGFDRSFKLAPIPDRRLGHIEATYRTVKGTIKSAWKYLTENGMGRNCIRKICARGRKGSVVLKNGGTFTKNERIRFWYNCGGRG
jgi:alpha-L-rhamnosidase